MRIAMIGSGYVGLVSGACFSDFGHVVTCIDKDASKISQLHNGTMPLFEPGLDALVARNVKAGRLSFTQLHGWRDVAQLLVARLIVPMIRQLLTEHLDPQRAILIVDHVPSPGGTAHPAPPPR